MVEGSVARKPAAPEHYDFRVVDGTNYLRRCYHLRYEVYCLEKQLLDAKNYPSEVESDEFDSVSIHVAALDHDDAIAGTLRLIQMSDLGFPLFRYCPVFPEYTYLTEKNSPALKTYGELSRLAVLEKYRRRPGDGTYGLSVARGKNNHGKTNIPRQRPGEIVIGLYKAMYQVSKRNGITHWFAAMERVLWRALDRFKFTFTPIGPESDYFGLVTPYVATITEIEQRVFRENPELFMEFTEGLDPSLVPSFAR